MTINNYFAQQVEKLLNDNIYSEENTLFVFKGFAIPQIEYLINHPNSLINKKSFIENEYLNIIDLNNNWFNILSALMSANENKIAFYEELIAIKNNLSMINGWQFVIVENNMFAPWAPSLLPEKDVLDYFDYIHQEHEAKDELTKYLVQNYADVKLLENGKSLVLPIVLEEENIKSIYFWNNEYTDTEYTGDSIIQIGSDKDWQYRIDVLYDKCKPALFLQPTDKVQVRDAAIYSALTVAGIDFSFDETELYKEKKKYDGTQFENILKTYWGKDAKFRDLLFYTDPDYSQEVETVSQGDIIAEIIDQCESANIGDDFENIFITAPTGAGKSILFQIPALYLAEKYNLITIVVSPLIALMNDQVNQLEEERGINIAACINSSMTIDQRMDVIEQIHKGEKSLLYLAPELLLTTHLKSFLGGRKIGLIVIDEAHTVTSWGRDFRSDYWFLGDFLKKSKREGFTFPVLCLTATAVYSGEDDVVNDTIDELGLEGTIIHLGNVKRKNVSFDIARHSSENITTNLEVIKFEQTLNRMREYISKNEKVLAYFPYRTQVDNIHNQILSSERVRIRRYHGQLDSVERKLVEKDYKKGTAVGLFCTKAFGMGVDVSDIKHIIHFAPTGTLADYVQEIGRAARNPNIDGIAHIDFFPNDLRYVRSLNSISEMRQYQLREMLKKIDSMYKSKKRRNLLISSETFEYLFDEKEVENRTKTGLQLIAKDLNNKYPFPVLIVRPQAMLSKNYVNIPYEIEDVFIEKYGEYLKKQDGENSRVISNKFDGGSDIQITSTGDTYLVDMAKIWENYYPDLTFGMFKKKFFEDTIIIKGKDYKVSPRVRVEISYKDKYQAVHDKLDKIINEICEVFKYFKNSEEKQFSLQKFDTELTNRLGERILNRDKLSLLLDIFTETTDVSASYSNSRNQLRVLRKRKDHKNDEMVYYVSSPSYARLPNTFIRLISQCKPNISEELFHRFYPMSKDKPIELMPLLRALELLGMASYELRGGEKAEVFIRINDPEKISRLAYGNYNNSVLKDIKEKHNRNAQMLSAFFACDMPDEERWNLIEQYFLGNNEYVYYALGMDIQ